MCCVSVLPDHHSPEPADPQISVVVPCHGIPSADLCRASHDLEARKKLWVILSPLAELPMGSGYVLAPGTA